MTPSHFDQLLAAKVRLAEVDALACVCVGVALLLVALCAFVARHRADDEFCKVHFGIGGCIIAALAATLIFGGAYDFATAGLKARAEVLQYVHHEVQLVK